MLHTCSLLHTFNPPSKAAFNQLEPVLQGAIEATEQEIRRAGETRELNAEITVLSDDLKTLETTTGAILGVPIPN